MAQATARDQQGKHGDHGRDLIHLRLHDLQVAAWRDLDVLLIPDVFGVLAAQFIGKGAQLLARRSLRKHPERGGPTCGRRVARVGERLASFDKIWLLAMGIQRSGRWPPRLAKA